ncbi:trace amine-associated receptor 13c-like [Anabas testudineus]|uniref:trace amine-associated receptor 13c-like n=1 Tax=Anabas testudineus TaxID=64144 RepID=UPI000E463EFF|nr:trace amine-associated receptor 13c-like [Anabas testudineus]
MIYTLLIISQLLTVFVSRQLHTPTSLLLLSLGVSDFFIGFLMIFQIMLIDGCWYLGDLMCALYYVMACIITSTSIGNMVLISVDRFVAICFPLHYSTKVTPSRVQVCVCMLWLCSAVIGILGIDLEHPGRYSSCSGECVFVIDYINGRIDLFVSFICPVTVIIVLYMRVFVVAVSQARAMRSHIVAVTHSISITAKKSEIKAARTLGVVVVAFLICLCPYFSVTLTGQDTLVNTSSSAFAICLFSFNSCLNPVIYAFFYPWFRKSIKLIVTLKILQPDSCDTKIT